MVSDTIRYQSNIKKFYYLQNNVLRYAVEFKTAKKHYVYSLFK